MDYFTAVTSRFDTRIAHGSAFGFVNSAKEFKCLGLIIDSSLTSDTDDAKRIKATTSVYGALKNFLANLSVDLRVKR